MLQEWREGMTRARVALAGVTSLARVPRVARAAFRAGSPVRAEAVLLDLVARRGLDSRAGIALGQLALLRDDPATAETRLAELVARSPRNRTAHELLAEARYRQDDVAGAAASFATVGRSAMAAKLRALSATEPYAIHGPAEVKLPFLQRDPLPIVCARLGDGEGDEVPFLIDTGAGETIIDDAVAERFAMRRFGQEADYFAAGQRVRFEHAVIAALGLGELVIHDLPATVMQLAPIAAALGLESLGGILGTGLFYRVRATLDYPAHELRVRRKQARLDAGESTATCVPFWLAGDHFILAEGRLNDAPPALFFVDTGLGGAAFTCPRSTLAAARIDTRAATPQSGQGAAGIFHVRPFEIEKLALGDVRRERLVGLTGAFPPQLEWEQGMRIGGLISHQFFLPFAVTFDFAGRALRLTQASTAQP